MSLIDQHINDPVILCSIIVFIGTIMIQLYYTFFIFYKLAFYNSYKPKQNPDIPVSVIIAARNESSALRKNLASILNQEHPEFEVIVVNNH